MVKNQLIVYLLLVLISFQFLPLKELVKFYNDNQLVEEVCQTANADGKNGEGSEDLKKNELYCTLNTLTLAVNLSTPLPNNSSDNSYVSRLADDAPTRPPLSVC